MVLNMAIMTRAGQKAVPYLDEQFIKGLHARANLDPEERYICLLYTSPPAFFPLPR